MKSSKFPKKQIIAYLIVAVVVLVSAAFGSGYFIGHNFGYQKGANQNDVVLTKVLNNFIENKGKFRDLIQNQDSKYAAFGEITEIREDRLVLMNIFGIRKEVLKTEDVDNFESLVEGDRIFVVGDPEGEDVLSSRFYKKMPTPTLRILGN